MAIDPEDPRGELDPDLVRPPATAEAPEGHDPAVAGATSWVVTPKADALPIAPIHRHPVLRVAVWIVGLIGLALLALVDARVHQRAGGAADASYGYAAGLLVGAMAMGLLVAFVVGRVRRSGTKRSIAWTWSLPVAAVVLVASTAALPVPSSATQGGTATPTGSAPPASAYVKISTPYSLGPTTSADADFVTQTEATVGQAGITDAKVVRVIGADGSFTGYLTVIVSADAAADPQGALAGMLDSLKQQSITPTTTTIDGRSVSLFNGPGTSGAAWFDSVFVVDVLATDQATASAIAKAVLDAQ